MLIGKANKLALCVSYFSLVASVPKDPWWPAFCGGNCQSLVVWIVPIDDLCFSPGADALPSASLTSLALTRSRAGFLTRPLLLKITWDVGVKVKRGGCQHCSVRESDRSVVYYQRQKYVDTCLRGSFWDVPTGTVRRRNAVMYGLLSDGSRQVALDVEHIRFPITHTEKY